MQLKFQISNVVGELDDSPIHFSCRRRRRVLMHA